MRRALPPTCLILVLVGCHGLDTVPTKSPTQPSLDHVAVVPPESEAMQWWGQLPSVVGTDVEFQDRAGRPHVFVGAMGVGFHVLDIADPAHPVLVGTYASPGWQNDIQIQGDLAILSNDLPPDPNFPTCETCGTFEGIELVDISNPAVPVRIIDLATDGGAHNATLIGSLVYVSNPSRNAVDVIDVADPAAPVVLVRYTTEGNCAGSPYPCRVIAAGEADWDPHDVTALTMPDKGHRLYVGAIDASFIVDANDPFKLRVVSKIPNGDFRAGYQNIEIAHQADPSPDGGLLVVSDERGGGVSETQCPGGGLHVYDITAEASPRKLGVYFANTQNDGNCTAHNFRFLPDRNVLTLGWYSAGTWVVDLGAAPGEGEFDNSAERPGQATTWGRTLGHVIMPGADTWAAKSPGVTADGRMFVYTGDMGRGMDVFEYTGSLPPAFTRPKR